MTLAAALLAFAAATATSQALLRGEKVQLGLRRVAAVHLLFAATAVGALANWGGANPAVLLLFWTGAGLSWFVVRSHLESSILLAMLDHVARGIADREELPGRLGERHGFEARMRELELAGLVSAGDAPRITRKGRFVSSCFAALEGPRFSRGR